MNSPKGGKLGAKIGGGKLGGKIGGGKLGGGKVGGGKVSGAKKKSGKKVGGKGTSARAGLTFPVARVSKYLRKGRFAPRLGVGASIFTTAVIEYLVAELLELSGNCCREHKKARIIPRHIKLAIKNDAELNKLIGKVTISTGGVAPNVHPSLFNKTGSAKKAE
jgi:histone H2A